MAERKVELLVPAGSLEVLKVAVDYGADAVYIGGQAYGLRAKADNFSIEEMKKAVKYAHAKNAKVYVTANIFAHNYDIEGMKAYFEQLKDTGVDAVLVSDPGIFMLAKEIMPDMELHISTQANNTNYLTYNFWYNMGAKRVVTARELSLVEIKQIREHIPEDMEIESFIHGVVHEVLTFHTDDAVVFDEQDAVAVHRVARVGSVVIAVIVAGDGLLLALVRAGEIFAVFGDVGKLHVIRHLVEALAAVDIDRCVAEHRGAAAVADALYHIFIVLSHAFFSFPPSAQLALDVAADVVALRAVQDLHVLSSGSG